MDTASYIVLSRQMGLFNKLDIVANNIANADTDGFKSESLLFKEFVVSAGDHGKTSFTHDVQSFRNTKQGDLKATGRSLDAAISGEGYYAVQTPLGTRYTRAGVFHLDRNGQMVTKDGYAVLDSASPIIFNSSDSNIQIAEDGTVTAQVPGGNNEIRGSLSVYKFTNPHELKKQGNNLYVTDQAARDAVPYDDYSIVQGMVEQSNVNSTKELTTLIEINRAVGATAKFINDVHDLQRKSISTISRMQ